MFRLTPIAIALSLTFIGSSVTVANSQGKPAHSRGVFCPPGLQKRDIPCVPPGLIKRYELGRPLPDGAPYDLITDLFFYGLDRPDGNWLYYLVDGEVLRIADASFTVLEALGFLGN